MANMSYCRFQNTLCDFEDCLDALDSGKAMSDDEQRAAFWLIKIKVMKKFSYSETRNNPPQLKIKGGAREVIFTTVSCAQQHHMN